MVDWTNKWELWLIIKQIDNSMSYFNVSSFALKNDSDQKICQYEFFKP